VGQAVGLGTGTGDAVETGFTPHRGDMLGTGLGVLSLVGGTVGTGLGVLSPETETVGTGFGVAARCELLGIAVGLATGRAEVFAAVAGCLPAVELSALAAVHPPHSRARPTTPPAALSAQLPVARAGIRVKSMYSS
jgi:hypothetical protein